jgi:hypothetical protein
MILRTVVDCINSGDVQAQTLKNKGCYFVTDIAVMHVSSMSKR